MAEPAIDFEAFGGDPNKEQHEWSELLHAHITGKMGEGGDAISAWLHDLEINQTPKIRAELEVIGTLDAFAAGRWQVPQQHLLPPLDDCPDEYREVLLLLRRLCASGVWPATSSARSKVVRAGDGGSFSVGSAQEHETNGWAGKHASTFPELTAAIFELEKAIMPSGRIPSTWVAINHNAMFAPHTDAGGGLGQSTSLIVGLGAYLGGELVVEGTVSDIRYRPLEFDGWRQRHWTLPYAGERFSLVWFTPA